MFSGHASALRTPGAMRWDDVSVPYKYGTISGLRRRPYICIDRGRVGFLFVFVALCVFMSVCLCLCACLVCVCLLLPCLLVCLFTGLYVHLSVRSFISLVNLLAIVLLLVFELGKIG